MSTTSPPPATPDGADPSMEEILASIRRILNDDDVPPAPADEAPVAEAPAEEDDVLILDETMMVAAPEAPSENFAEPVHQPEPVAAKAEPIDFDDIVFEPPVRLPPEAEPPPPPIETWTATPQPEPAEAKAPDLIGPEAAAAAAFSVGTLVRTLSASRATQVYTGGPTLEDMVRGELRPLLKDWLDQHLPPMVERLVRAEIERVVGRFVP